MAWWSASVYCSGILRPPTFPLYRIRNGMRSTKNVWQAVRSLVYVRLWRSMRTTFRSAAGKKGSTVRRPIMGWWKHWMDIQDVCLISSGQERRKQAGKMCFSTPRIMENSWESGGFSGNRHFMRMQSGFR